MTPTAIDSTFASPNQQFTASTKSNGAAQVAASSSPSLDSLSSISESHLDYNQINPQTATTESRLQFIQQLRQCLVGVGFFYLQNSPLNQRRDAIFDNSQRFFDLPSDVRNSIKMENSRHFRGYSKFGDERTLGKVDYRDQIDFGPEALALSESYTSQHSFANLIGPNQFLPSEILPNQKEIILDWFETSHELSLEITDALEEALGLKQKGRFKDYLVGDGDGNETKKKQNEENGNLKGGSDVTEVEMKYGRMKTIRYPTGESVDGIQRLENGAQGVGAHKDGGWLTLLSTSPVKGLEVQNLDGKWLEVPHVEGAIIVNFGQQLEFLSRGMINAATHRVVSNTSGKDRLSVAWFATPKLNSKLIELKEEEIGVEFKEIWKEELKRRKEIFGNVLVKSDVKEKDLHSKDRFFGETAWEGLCRSHPNVVERWYS